jgi:serine/threonine protein phosphatase PrpC
MVSKRLIAKCITWFKIYDSGKLIIILKINFLCINSGSTCVSLMTIGRRLFIANVGDSRAIIIKGNGDSKFIHCYLTHFYFVYSLHL